MRGDDVRARRDRWERAIAVLVCVPFEQCSPITLYAIWTIKFRQPNEWWLLQQVKQHPTILITVFPPGFVQPLDGVVLTFLADESLIRVTFRGGLNIRSESSDSQNVFVHCPQCVGSTLTARGGQGRTDYRYTKAWGLPKKVSCSVFDSSEQQQFFCEVPRVVLDLIQDDMFEYLATLPNLNAFAGQTSMYETFLKYAGHVGLRRVVQEVDEAQSVYYYGYSES